MFGNEIIVGSHMYALSEMIRYNSFSYSQVFVCENDAIIIDYNICNKKEFFSYQKYTNVQNQFVNEFDHMYRFLYEDSLSIGEIEAIIYGENEYNKMHSYKTRDYVLDNTPVENHFEERFIELFGYENIGKLQKEYTINDEDGNSYILDYYIESKDEKVAIEENGVNYHHPQIIGEEAYKHQLKKQNVCSRNNIKLYRFSTEDIKFVDKLNEDLSLYLTNIVKNGYEKVIKVDRGFKLYQHQIDNLNEIREKRKKGLKSCLIVLPTASGKSKIIEEDLTRIKEKMNVLVLGPSIRIVQDWKERLNGKYIHNFVVCSNSLISKNYNQYDNEYFDYIVVDEAHHAVAPMMKRVLQYFNPKFMIGITATDERLDNQKLEEVFGQYESKLSLKEAMEKGIVSNARVFRIESNIDLSEIRFNGKDYVSSDLEKHIRVDSRNDLIGQVLNKYFNNGCTMQGIVFCVNKSHASEMSKVLKTYGISSETLVSGNKNNEQIIKDFKDKKIRFLCSCQMINEGWDYPNIEILVMARPTMSKVLYTQQIGRGLRKAEGKECVYVIDVVDEYGAMATPWSMHSLFKIPNYVPFGDPLVTYKENDFIVVNGLVESVKSIKEININTFEDLYGNYLSTQQLAIEFFVGDNTIENWRKKGEINADLEIKFGNKKIYYYSPENIEKIRVLKEIDIHDRTTIKKDFLDFINEYQFTFSFKIIFMLCLIKNIDINGLAKIDDVLSDYIRFYKERIEHGLKVDRENCILDLDKLNDLKYMKKSMLDNPFEKFERKRFIFYSKDLSELAFSSDLFNQLSHKDINDIIEVYKKHLEKYYKDLDGLGNIEYLVGKKYEL